MKKIVGVNLNIPSEDDSDFISFTSKASLTHADIVVFRPDYNELYDTYHLDEPGIFQGKSCYSKNSSFIITGDANHWQQEICQLLSAGKTVFILMCEFKPFYIHTGQRETSGTGRNQRVTNIVDEFDNYRFLPIKLKLRPTKGTHLIPADDLLKPFHATFTDSLYFENHIIEFGNGRVICYAADRKTVTGVLYQINSGNLILLPNLYIDYSFYRNEKTGGWKKDGVIFGNKFWTSLVDIDKVVRNRIEKSPPPDWVKSELFAIKSAEETKKQVQQLDKKIADLSKERQTLLSKIGEQEILKDLLFESGKPLENAVIIALKILGYKAEGYNDGALELDQVIISPEGKRFIGECEGKDNKDIDITKFRQLIDSINEDFQRDEIEEKAFGILIGNPQRLTDPNNRTLDFTKKCQTGASRDKIALIKSPDLFYISRYIQETGDQNFATLCRAAIENGLGKIIQFPEHPTKEILSD